MTNSTTDVAEIWFGNLEGQLLELRNSFPYYLLGLKITHKLFSVINIVKTTWTTSALMDKSIFVSLPQKRKFKLSWKLLLGGLFLDPRSGSHLGQICYSVIARKLTWPSISQMILDQFPQKWQQLYLKHCVLWGLYELIDIKHLK